MLRIIVLLAFAIVYGLQLLNLKLGSLLSPGPGFFPLILLALFISFLTIEAVQQTKRKSQKISSSYILALIKKQWITFVFLICTIAYVFILKKIGYFIASLLYVFVLTALFEVASLKDLRNWRLWARCLFTTIGIVGTVYILFNFAFKIVLP